MAFAHHITMQLAGTDRLARSDDERCYLARLVVQTGDRLGLLWWRVAGPYLQVVCRCDRREAGQLGRRLGIGAQQVLGGAHRFVPARVRAIDDRFRLDALFDGVLQADPLDPFHVGSAIPDLLGLRRTGACLVPRVRALLPGLRPRLLDLVGRSSFAPPICDWKPLGSATAAVFGHADLSRRWPWRTRALAAAAELGAPLLGTRATAGLLGVSASAVRRARQRLVSPALVQTVQLQLQWRQTGERFGPTLACGLSCASPSPAALPADRESC
jgi:hypothetical protein